MVCHASFFGSGFSEGVAFLSVMWASAVGQHCRVGSWAGEGLGLTGDLALPP